MRPFNSSLILSLRAEALSAPPRPRTTQRVRAPRRPRARRRLVGCALLTEASAMRPFNSSLILSLRAEALSAPPRPRATQRVRAPAARWLRASYRSLCYAPVQLELDPLATRRSSQRAPRPRATQRLRAPRRPRARRRLVGCALLTEASAMRPFNSSLILSLRAEALSAPPRPRATQRLRAPRRPRARRRLVGCALLTEASAMRPFNSSLILSLRAEALSAPPRPRATQRLRAPRRPRARRRLVGCALLTEASAMRPFNSSLILSLRAEALSALQRPRATQRLRAPRRPRARQRLFGCVHLTEASAMRLLASWLVLSRRAEAVYARPATPRDRAGSLASMAPVRAGGSLAARFLPKPLLCARSTRA